MRKSDVLFLIVGTNPMPNVISIVNRIKENGQLYLIHSHEDDTKFSTEKIAKELIKILNEKFNCMKVKSIAVDKLKETSMIFELKNRFSELNVGSDDNKTIELNYTGGTKLMSSTIYGYFKRKLRKENNDIILSYLDSEKDIFVYEEMQNGEVRVVEEKIEEQKISRIFTIKDIINSHGLNYDKDKTDIKFLNVALDIYTKFEALTLDEKYIWLKEMNIILGDYFKNKKQGNNHLIMEFLQKYSNHSEIEQIKDLKIKEAIDYLIGESLEEYIFCILQSLKNDREIDDFIWSYEQQITDIMANIEIDFVIIKDTKNYLLSVTLCEEESECKLKLYEAKTRGEQLAGDETRIGFICLYKSYMELRELLDEDINYSKNLVIAIDNFTGVRNKILQWVRGNK